MKIFFFIQGWIIGVLESIPYLFSIASAYGEISADHESCIYDIEPEIIEKELMERFPHE